MDFVLHDTRICTECGNEIPTGLRNTVVHMDECERNAPNESISSYKEKIKWDKIYKAEEERINKIFPKMTADEQSTLAMYHCLGTPVKDGEDTIMLVGSKLYDRIDKFKNEMFAKYGR